MDFCKLQPKKVYHLFPTPQRVDDRCALLAAAVPCGVQTIVPQIGEVAGPHVMI